MANANYGSNAWYRRKLEVGKAFCEDLLSEKVTSMDEYILQTTEDISKYCLYSNISGRNVVYRGWKIASASSLAQKALYDKWG